MKVFEKKSGVENIMSAKMTIDNSLPDLSKHPVVLKKTETARKFLENHPIPEHILRK